MSETRWKVVTLVGALVLPLVGLALLLAVPSIDVRWEHHPSHFWLVLSRIHDPVLQSSVWTGP